MARKIIIDADLRGAEKSFSKFSKTITKMFGGKGIDFKINTKAMADFKKFSLDTVNSLKKELAGYERELERINEIKRKTGKLDEKEFINRRKIHRLMKETRGDLGKQRSNFQAGNFFQRAGASATGAGHGVVGGVLGRIGNAARIMGPAGMALGGAVGAYMGARAIGAPRRQLAGANLTFRGLSRQALSEDQMEGLRESGVQYGFGPQETMQSAAMLQRLGGDVDRGSLSEFGRQRRVTGLDPETLTSITGAFRAAAIDEKGAALGGESGTQKRLMELYKTAMVSALDSSGAIKFMQQSAQMTEQIANEGSADINAIQGTLTALAQADEFYKANVGRSIAAFKGAEGFFRSKEGTGLAIRAMTGAGMSGGPAELLFKQQLGFTQGDISIGGDTFKGMGGKGLSAITKELAFETTGETNLEGMNRDQKAMAALTLQQQFGISASNAGRLLEAGMTGKLEEMSPDQLKKLLQSEDDERHNKEMSIWNSMDHEIKENEARLEELITDIGDPLVKHMSSMEDGIWRLVEDATGVTRAKSTQELQEESKISAAAAAKEKKDDTVMRWIGSSVGLNPEQNRQMIVDEELARRNLKAGSSLTDEQSEAMANKARKDIENMRSGVNEGWIRAPRIKAKIEELELKEQQLRDISETSGLGKGVHGPVSPRDRVDVEDEGRAADDIKVVVGILREWLESTETKKVDY